MKFSNPRIEQLQEMIALEEQSSALQGELDLVSQKLSALRAGLSDERPTPPKVVASTVKRGPKRASSVKGTLREKVMAALEAAGSDGVRVKDLAAAWGVKPVNIHSWFHSNLKRNPTIKKLVGGHYRLEGSSADVAPVRRGRRPNSAKTSQPAKLETGKPQRGRKRGALSSKILNALTTAGSEGLSVKELSDKIGAKYKNIYIWFATTGKKQTGVKKLGPARYKLDA